MSYPGKMMQHDPFRRPRPGSGEWALSATLSDLLLQPAQLLKPTLQISSGESQPHRPPLDVRCRRCEVPSARQV